MKYLIINEIEVSSIAKDAVRFSTHLAFSEGSEYIQIPRSEVEELCHDVLCLLAYAKVSNRSEATRSDKVKGTGWRKDYDG